MADYSLNNRQIAKNTILLYGRSLFLLVLSLYTSRVVLQVLGVEDYGIYNVVGGVVAMFAILGSTMTSASQRFITYALGKGDSERLKKVFSTCVSLHIILGVIVLVLLEAVGVWFINYKLNIPSERQDIAQWVFQFSAFTFFVNIIAVPYNSAIIAHEKLDAFAYITILEGVLKLVVVLSLKAVPLDKLLYYAIFQFIVALIIRSIYTIYSSKNFEETKKVKYKIDKSLFKEMFAFSGWNLIGSGALVLRNQGIDILLNLFFGVAVNAAKGIANQVQGAIQILVGNFTTSITPQLTKSVAQKDEARTNSLIFHGSRLSFFLMMLFAVPLLICTNELLEIWLVNVPEFTTGMVRLIVVYLLSDTLSRFLINGLLAYGDIRNFQLIIGGIKLLALPIAYIIFIFGGGPLTGLWVNIVLDFVCLWGRLIFTRRRLHLSSSHFIFKAVIPCWFALAAALLPSFAFHRYVNSNIIVCGSACVISSIVSIALFMEKSEMTIVKSIINKILRK